MRQVVTACLIATWVFFGGQGWAFAQVGGVPLASVGFRSELKSSVIVQGYSIVNGAQKRGQPLLLGPGSRIGLDANVTPGIRFYCIYDSNQPNNALLRDFPVPIKGQELFFSIKISPANPNRAVLVPASGP